MFEALKRLKLNIKANTKKVEEVDAITDEVFDSWDSKKQKQWIKDHPTSKYAQKDYKKKSSNTKSDESQVKVIKAIDKIEDKLKQLRRSKPLDKKAYKKLLDKKNELMGKSLNLNSKDKEKEEKHLKEIKKDPWNIEYIKNPSEKVQLEAVKNAGYTIQYIKNPSEKVQLEAIKQNGGSMQYIKNPSEKVQLEAVKQDGRDIMYIKNPSEKVQLEAIKQNLDAFKYIKNPSEKVQLEAIKQNPKILDSIKNPSKKLVQLTSKAFKKVKDMGIDTDSKEYKNSLTSTKYNLSEIERNIPNELRAKDVETDYDDGILIINWVSNSKSKNVKKLIEEIKNNLSKNSKNSTPVPVKVKWCSRDNKGDWSNYEFVLDKKSSNTKSKTPNSKDKKESEPSKEFNKLIENLSEENWWFKKAHKLAQKALEKGKIPQSRSEEIDNEEVLDDYLTSLIHKKSKDPYIKNYIKKLDKLLSSDEDNDS